MLSLSEYIRTLKNYNPGITDKSIKIYLLKDGWNIDEIENAFKVVNGVVAAPESVNPPQPVSVQQSNSQPTSTPLQSGLNQTQVVPGPKVASIPESISSSQFTPKPSTSLEVQPEELSKDSNSIRDNQIGQSSSMSKISDSQDKKTIAYPTFEQVQAAVSKSVDPLPKPGIDTSIIPPKQKIDMQVQPPVQPIVQGPGQSQIQPKSEFGAPIDSRRPQFSYKDIMGPTQPGEVGVPVYKPEDIALAQASTLKNSASPITSPVSASKQISQTAVMPEYGNLREGTQTLAQIAGTNVTMTPAQAEAYAKLIASQKENFKQSQQAGNTNVVMQGRPVANSQPAMSGVLTPPVSKMPSPINMQTAQTTKPKAIHNSSSGKLAKVLGIGLLLIAILGGGGYGYMNYVHGIYVFVEPPFAKENFIKGFAESLVKVDTASYEASIGLKASPKEESLAELDLSKYEDELDDSTYYQSSSQDLLQYIPTDAEFMAGINGVYNKQADSQDGRFGFTGSYTGDGLSINVDVESVKVGPNLYARINTFPAFFIDLSKIKDKWILLTEEDIKANFGGSFNSILGLSTEEESLGDKDKDLTQSEAKAQLVAILEFANQKQIFEVIGEPVKNTLNRDRVIYEYEVKPNLANMISFFRELSPHMKEKFGDKYIGKDNESSEEDLKQLETPEFAYYFNYIRENTRIVVGIDTKGRLAYIDSLSKVAFKDSVFKKQLETSLRLNLNNVNGKNEVYAPTNSIPYLDAYSEVTGKSKEMILMERQSNNIRSIQEALKKYQRYSGEFPVLLEDLNTSTAKLANASTTFLLASSGGDYWSQYYFSTSTSPIFRGSFIDVYTGQRYTYKKTDKSTYVLIYEMKLPPVSGDLYKLQYAVSEARYASRTSGSTIRNLKFVNGPNTANELNMSKEAFASSNSDKDGDTLSDSLEAYLGTNINKADTDGDGVNDYNEMLNGKDPKVKEN